PARGDVDLGPTRDAERDPQPALPRHRRRAPRLSGCDLRRADRGVAVRGAEPRRVQGAQQRGRPPRRLEPGRNARGDLLAPVAPSAVTPPPRRTTTVDRAAPSPVRRTAPHSPRCWRGGWPARADLWCCTRAWTLATMA